MRRLKYHIKAFLNYRNEEISGVMLILVIILIFSLVKDFILKEKKPHKIELKHIEDTLFSSKPKQYHYYLSSKNDYKKKEFHLFKFDPNTIDSQGWVKLGFSAKQTHFILKYRTKGGRFNKPTDLLNLFCISNEKYKQLESYVEIKDGPKPLKPMVIASHQEPKIELNRATIDDLVKIKGVNEKLAMRIIKYKELLGGYISTDQLKEVYYMSDFMADRISVLAVADSLLIEKICINTRSAYELSHHPYLKYPLAKAIVNIRNQHGKFTDINEIKKLGLLSDSLFIKLRPYLSIY